MANLQKYFEIFHQRIRTDYEINGTLREKRDAILKLLSGRLKEAGHPSCDELLQGSYRMGTGVKPPSKSDLEFDIDVGLRFNFDAAKYPAKDVRAWVFQAVKDHTDSVEEKGHCIRVGYSKGFHVDLVAYANWQSGMNTEQFRLAHASKGWLNADPPALLEFVKKARKQFDTTEDSATGNDQLQRVVRYLKRWDDVATPSESSAKPCGLAFVLLVIQSMAPTKSWDGLSDDGSALCTLSQAAGNTNGRISINKPVPEYDDVFANLDDKQMEGLKNRFRQLTTHLEVSASEADPVKACTRLREVFGEDFPIPDSGNTGKKTSAPAIVTSSSSA